MKIHELLVPTSSMKMPQNASDLQDFGTARVSLLCSPINTLLDFPAGYSMLTSQTKLIDRLEIADESTPLSIILVGLLHSSLRVAV